MTCSSEEWDNLFDVNVKSAWALSKEIYPHIPKGGSILFISHAYGYQPNSIFDMTRTLIFGVSQTLSKELGAYGIRVNTISFGEITLKNSVTDGKTMTTTTSQPEIGSIRKETELKDDTITKIIYSSTLQRSGSPLEIASVAAFLGSHEASYITGENVMVSGGTLGSRI